MSLAEDMLNLRKKINDAVKAGVAPVEGEDILNGVLSQLMNEAERNRLSCAQRAEHFRREAEKMDGQASAFASQGSLIFGIVNGYISLAEKAVAEEKRKAEMDKDDPELVVTTNPNDSVSEEVLPTEEKAPSKRKKKS